MMYSRRFYIGLSIILGLPLLGSILAFNLDNTPRNTVELVDYVKSGTVLIANQIDATSGGTGTGFILEDNMIITNNHVIEGKGTIKVYSAQNSKYYVATVVYTDPLSDIAVLRLRDWEMFESEVNPTNLTLGDSNAMREGSKVVVIGHPWGLTWTVSEGILAAKHRRIGPNPKFVDQIDAKLFQGNSGGPVFNERGEVICVSNMMLTGLGGSYGFCVPSNLVRKVVHDFLTLKEVRWRAMSVTLGLTSDGKTVILNSVEPDGPAGKAGLLAGDKLLKVYTPNNHPRGRVINRADDVITELATMNGDDEKVKLIIERNGEQMMIDVITTYKTSDYYTPDKVK
jgi:serine protease Do